MSRAASPPLISVRFEAPVAAALRAMWLSFHVWDLDAPSVALAWQFLFAHYLHVSVSWAAALALAIAVWLIYAGDRILDVRCLGDVQSTARHAFHRRHRAPLTVLAAIAMATLLALSMVLRPALVKSGFTLAGCVAVYLACVHLFPGPQRRWFPKEVVVGILFAVGTCLAPWCRSATGLTLLLPGLLFAALCCINCVLIEVWEWRDSGSSSASHPHVWTLWLSCALRPFLLGVAIAAAGLYLMGLHSVFAAVLLSSLLLLLLDHCKGALSTDARRILADAALLTPVLFLIAN